MISDSKNSYFTASLLFRSSRDGEILPDNLWEESIVLIEAQTPEEAMEKAARLGKSRIVYYRTENGQILAWDFYKVERVFEIDAVSLTNGVEIFSRHLRNSEVASLLIPFDDEQK